MGDTRLFVLLEVSEEEQVMLLLARDCHSIKLAALDVEPDPILDLGWHGKVRMAFSWAGEGDLQSSFLFSLDSPNAGDLSEDGQTLEKPPDQEETPA